MRPIKSERLKKLETELEDLKQWMKLGLVPKKDEKKHKEEMQSIQAKIDEEKERLNFLKESGEVEDVQTKRPAGRTAYTEMPTIPDIDPQETQGGSASDSRFDYAQGSSEHTGGYSAGTDDDQEDEEGDEEGDLDTSMEDESYFSDRNRWKRGGIVDPEANDW